MIDEGKTKIKLNLTLVPSQETFNRVLGIVNPKAEKIRKDKRYKFDNPEKMLADERNISGNVYDSRLEMIIGQVMLKTYPSYDFRGSKPLIINLREQIEFESPYNCEYRGNGRGKLVWNPGKKRGKIVSIKEFLLEREVLRDDESRVSQLVDYIDENSNCGEIPEDLASYCECLLKNRYVDPMMILARDVPEKFAKKVIRELQEVPALSFDRVRLSMESSYLKKDRNELPLKAKRYG